MKAYFVRNIYQKLILPILKGIGVRKNTKIKENRLLNKILQPWIHENLIRNTPELTDLP